MNFFMFSDIISQNAIFKTDVFRCISEAFCGSNKGEGLGSPRKVRLMCDKIDILGVHIDYYNVATSMERIAEMMKNDRMDTVGIVTMNTLLLAAEDPTWKQYLEEMDLTVIGESEVLKAAGIQEGQIAEEVEENEFIARFFWYMIQQQERLFVLGETKEEVEGLRTYLQDAYPGIEIVGGAVVEDDTPAEGVMNEINSLTVDVIVSGLQGHRQDRLAIENRSQLNSKIWFCLGEHPNIQTDAGLKVSWWSTLLKKNAFKRMVAKYNEGKESGI